VKNIHSHYSTGRPSNRKQTIQYCELWLAIKCWQGSKTNKSHYQNQKNSTFDPQRISLLKLSDELISTLSVKLALLDGTCGVNQNTCDFLTSIHLQRQNSQLTQFFPRFRLLFRTQQFPRIVTSSTPAVSLRKGASMDPTSSNVEEGQKATLPLRLSTEANTASSSTVIMEIILDTSKGVCQGESMFPSTWPDEC
jgi:hypothetical protein